VLSFGVIIVQFYGYRRLRVPSYKLARTKLNYFREWLWPVKSHEFATFFPLFYIKFAASFIYCILFSIKETVIITAAGSGAEAIPVLKGGVVLTAAFLMMLAYSKLSNILDMRRLFYVILTPFLVFFLIYGWYIFPNRELLALHSSADKLATWLGSGHSHWVSVYRYWMNSLFFVLSELWGGIAIGVLFWSFANTVTDIKAAAKFYPLYTAGGHIGTICAGLLGFLITGYSSNYFSYDFNIKILMSLVFALGLSIFIAFYFVSSTHAPKLHKINLTKAKTQLSLIESLRYIMRSPYIGLIAVIVISYGLSVNMIEVAWKALLKMKYPNPAEYQQFLSMLLTILGVVSTIVAVGVGGGFIRRFGWYLSAQLTPLVLGITSLLFFIVYFMCPDLNSTDTIIFSMTPLSLMVVIGTLHNVACKSMKYSMFDPTKEMAYIPLSQEEKIKGKACVDLLGARFGKSGSSFLQLFLIDILGAGSILTVVPLLVPCVAIVVGIWAFAVHLLNLKISVLGKAKIESSNLDEKLVGNVPVAN